MNEPIAKFLVVAFWALLFSSCAEAKTVYKYVDSETGITTYADVQPKDMTNVYRKEFSRRYDASTRTDQLVARMRLLLTHYDRLYQDPVNLYVAPSQPVTREGPQVTIAQDGPSDPGVCRQLLGYQFGDIGLLGRRPWASEQRDVTYYRNRYGC